MKQVYFLLLLLFSVSISVQAQTSAGKCWDIDYETWNINQPQLHIDCGNSDAFNVGDELTLELWVRAYTFGENRKIMGKISSDGSVYDNGYVLGFENLNPYAEIWNPTLQRIPYPGAGPIPQDSAFVHIACTYSSITGKLSDYINGQLIGEIDVFPPSPIAANDAIFLIGAAPWGPDSYQFYGALDEVRVWNKARTEAEIAEFMFKELQGNEEGLVAYYNFNTATDTLVPDMSANDNRGEVRNSDDPSWSWADSYVPVGDINMYSMHDLVAAWYGKAPELFNYATTENGLSIITDIEEKVFDKYLVFGHNNGVAISVENPPANAPEDFMRYSREWYINSGGSFASDMYFDLNLAAGGSLTLPLEEPDSLYVLLWRSDVSESCKAIAYPDNKLDQILVYNRTDLPNGYYTIGYASTVITLESTGINEKILDKITIGPNPVQGHLNIQNGDQVDLKIYDLQGKLLFTKSLTSNHESIDVSQLNPGMYLVELRLDHHFITKKIIINK